MTAALITARDFYQRKLKPFEKLKMFSDKVAFLLLHLDLEVLIYFKADKGIKVIIPSFPLF